MLDGLSTLAGAADARGKPEWYTANFGRFQGRFDVPDAEAFHVSDPSADTAEAAIRPADGLYGRIVDRVRLGEDPVEATVAEIGAELAARGFTKSDDWASLEAMIIEDAKKPPQ